MRKVIVESYLAFLSSFSSFFFFLVLKDMCGLFKLYTLNVDMKMNRCMGEKISINLEKLKWKKFFKMEIVLLCRFTVMIFKRKKFSC